MNKLELQKTANEVRKGIVTAVHSAKAGDGLEQFLERFGEPDSTAAHRRPQSAAARCFDFDQPFP